MEQKKKIFILSRGRPLKYVYMKTLQWNTIYDAKKQYKKQKTDVHWKLRVPSTDVYMKTLQ